MRTQSPRWLGNLAVIPPGPQPFGGRGNSLAYLPPSPLRPPDELPAHPPPSPGPRGRPPRPPREWPSRRASGRMGRASPGCVDFPPGWCFVAWWRTTGPRGSGGARGKKGPPALGAGPTKIARGKGPKNVARCSRKITPQSTWGPEHRGPGVDFPSDPRAGLGVPPGEASGLKPGGSLAPFTPPPGEAALARGVSSSFFFVLGAGGGVFGVMGIFLFCSQKTTNSKTNLISNKFKIYSIGGFV